MVFCRDSEPIMQDRISEIQNQAKEDLANAKSPDEVESIKTNILEEKAASLMK